MFHVEMLEIRCGRSYRDHAFAAGGRGKTRHMLTCFIWKSGAAGLIEIVRLLQEAKARPDTRSHVSFKNSGGVQQQFYSRDRPVRLLFLN